MIKSFNRRSNLVVCFLWILCCLDKKQFVSGDPNFETKLEKDVVSPFHALHHRLDMFNYNLQNDLKESDATLNELDESGYYNDQTNIRRAWSNENLKKEQQDQLDMYYMKLASENAKNVMEIGKCKIPTRRCLNVQKMRMGDEAKTYWPSCAIVHKCGHDSGCCSDINHSCTPVKSKRIELYFYSFRFSVRNEQRGRVEMLTFENHTECGCRKTSMIDLFDATNHQEDFTTERPKRCNCPKHFSPSSEMETDCVCECSSSNSKMCRRITRGRRSYNLKGCKGKGQCGEPLCEYGTFKKNFGRCPRKSERERRRRRRRRM